MEFADLNAALLSSVEAATYEYVETARGTKYRAHKVPGRMQLSVPYSLYCTRMWEVEPLREENRRALPLGENRYGERLTALITGLQRESRGVVRLSFRVCTGVVR